MLSTTVFRKSLFAAVITVIAATVIFFLWKNHAASRRAAPLSHEAQSPNPPATAPAAPEQPLPPAISGLVVPGASPGTPAAESPTKNPALAQRTIADRRALANEWAQIQQRFANAPPQVWQQQLALFQQRNRDRLIAQKQTLGADFPLVHPSAMGPGFDPMNLDPGGTAASATVTDPRLKDFLATRESIEKERLAAADGITDPAARKAALQAWESENEPRLRTLRQEAAQLRQFAITPGPPPLNSTPP